MRILQTIKDLQDALKGLLPYSHNIAFAPTMGALHEGHINLITAARSAAKTVVASIFVNPTQFNDPADYSNYPKSLEADINMLEAADTDILFMPSVETMYPNGADSGIHYPIGRLETLLEGAFRPGHYQGVCQVVHKLLEAVRPGQLFMGQKDFQQCMVVQQMIDYLHLPVKMQMIPTVREPDGLAMSSRNRRLTNSDRQTAVALSKVLRLIADQSKEHSFRKLEAQATENLLAAGFQKVDYVSIAEASTLEPANVWSANTPLVVLAAAYLGEIRLIDNLLLPHAALPTTS